MLSLNARFVTWWSSATNLVPDDTNDQSDVFLRDMKAQGTTRASVTGPDAEADGDSFTPSISSNGRVVAFVSPATNLVPGDTNATSDLFVWDAKKGQMTRASISSDGVQGDGACFVPALSSNGRVVAFASNATNLVPGDTNGDRDIFVHDLKKAQTTRVSVSTGGEEGNGSSPEVALSSNGRVLAFESDASNLVPGDTNAVRDVFMRDMKLGQTTRASVGADGTEGDGSSRAPALSSNGRILAFSSVATNLVPGDSNGVGDVFLRDLKTGAMTRASVGIGGAQANGSSSEPSLSPNGRLVAFSSGAANLVSGDDNAVDDIFIHDTKTGETTRVSVRSDGGQGDGSSYEPVLSPSGRYVVFSSDATNLVPNDTNGMTDVFLHDRKTAQTVRVSVSADGAQADSNSEGPAFTSNSRTVVFYSSASNLVPLDDNGSYDVFLSKLE